jgi:hypothetical protein
MCARCPHGSVCLGKLALPTPINDFWAPTFPNGSLLLPWEHSRADSVVLDIAEDPYPTFRHAEMLVFECEPHRCERECEEECDEAHSAAHDTEHNGTESTSSELSPYHSDEPAGQSAAIPSAPTGHRRLLGGGGGAMAPVRAGCHRVCKSTCVHGYMGNMCSLCSEGYFRAVEQCMQCPSPEGVTAIDWVMTIGLISLVVIVWLTMNKMAAGKYDALELTLLYLQCVALVLHYRVPWPSALMDVKHIIVIFNFEMDFVTPGYVRV